MNNTDTTAWTCPTCKARNSADSARCEAFGRGCGYVCPTAWVARDGKPEQATILSVARVSYTRSGAPNHTFTIRDARGMVRSTTHVCYSEDEAWAAISAQEEAFDL